MINVNISKHKLLWLVIAALLIVGCGGKKPDTYGVYVKSGAGISVIMPTSEMYKDITQIQIFDKPLRYISVRTPKPDAVKIGFFPNADMGQFEELTYAYKLIRKDIDWVVFEQKGTTRKGIYVVSEQARGEVMFVAGKECGEKFIRDMQAYEERMKTNSKISNVKYNMHQFQLFLEEYATKKNGHYPIDLKVYYPFKIVNPFDTLLDAIVVSNNDPPDWNKIEKGQVIYIPLQIVGGKYAKSYKVLGKGIIDPIGVILSKNN